jgi:hypothetical protein
MKLLNACAVVGLFIGQILALCWGIFLIYRNVPYVSIFCETYKLSTSGCPCVVNDGFICNSQGNFLTELQVECEDTIYTVFSSKEVYCECQDNECPKRDSNSWFPWVPNKFPLLSTKNNSYNSNQTEYFKQNGILYQSKNSNNSLFVASLLFIDFLVLVAVLGIMQYMICRSPQREEMIEMNEV